MITIRHVNDHRYVRKGIRYLLESLGDSEVVVTATNGIEAVAKARLHQPDVVIIDISMLLMNFWKRSNHFTRAGRTFTVRLLLLLSLPISKKFMIVGQAK